MTTPLRVLILEDRPADAELMVYELRRAGFDPTWERVDTADAYRDALAPDLDLILADYSLPQFDALGALSCLQERGLDVPMIIVSGAIGEDLAVAAMKQGATDYLLKDRLARLGPAIGRALEERRLRAAKREAERATQREAARAQALVRTAGVLTATLDLQRVLHAVCDETVRALSVPIATVSLYDEESQELRFAYGCGLPDGLAEQLQPVPRAVYDRYSEAGGSMVVVADVQTLPDLPNAALYRDLDVRTTVGAALLHQEQLVGRLNVATVGEQRAFSEDELELLRGLASQAAVAIQNAVLFEQVRVSRAQLQALSRRLVEVQEEERRHIAAELHDEIGQVLTGLKYTLEMSLRVPADAAQTHLDRAASLVQDLLARVRKLSLDLRPGMLDDLGLLPTLLWHFEQYTMQTRVKVHFEHSLGGSRFPPEVETAAYRIIQEALTNVARYASVAEVAVRVWEEDDALLVRVEDEGEGFEPRVVLASHRSSGLTGMRERATLLGGMLTVDSAPGHGARVTAVLPVERAC